MAIMEAAGFEREVRGQRCERMQGWWTKMEKGMREGQREREESYEGCFTAVFHLFASLCICLAFSLATGLLSQQEQESVPNCFTHCISV